MLLCCAPCVSLLVRSQLQIAILRASPPFTTFTGEVSFILRRRGVSGLYQGIVPTFARTIPSTAAYFGCYEWLRILLTPAGVDPSRASNTTILLAGGGGGFMYWYAHQPRANAFQHNTPRRTAQKRSSALQQTGACVA